jgi:sec-independent protein translocase protein TatB
MLDLGASELLLIVIVAVVVIGPKDLPLALRTAGKWIGKMRRLSGHFRTGLDAMIREAEMEEMEKKWKAQNEKIMRQDPATFPAEPEPTGALPARARAETPALPATEAVSPRPAEWPQSQTGVTAEDAPRAPVEEQAGAQAEVGSPAPPRGAG